MTLAYRPNLKLAFGIPLLIFISCFFITFTSGFKSNPDLFSTAIVLDLLITAPLLYYLAIRKSKISKLTVLRVFIAGILFSGLILNVHSNSLLQIVKTWVSPLIELVIISYIVRKFYIAGQNAKLSGINNVDFMTHCRMILSQVTGNEKAGNIISSEIGVLYYAFLGRKAKNIDNITKFTSYRENGILLILGTFLCLFLLETTGVHFLLTLWNNTAAWIMTVLSLYTCLQLFAHIRAVKARAITLNNDSLEIYNGLAGDAVIRYDNIDKVEMSDKIPNDRDAVKISLLNKLEKHNCVIYLKQPIQATKIFGIKKKADAVLFYVDDKSKFESALNLKLINNIN